MIQKLFKIIFFLLFNFLFLHAEQLSESFRLDGYGNITMSQAKNYQTDKLQFTGGVQGRYQLFDNMSITGQIHFEEGNDSQNRDSNALEDYDSELKWLYLDYYLEDDITLRMGAFQFPVFKSSETGDIGYTYTWTQTPLSFYGVFGCDDFKGVELLKNFSYKDFDFLAQISYGKSNNELSDGRGTTREGDVEDLIGLTLKTTHDKFILNIGYLQAKSTMHIDKALRDIVDPDVEFNMYALESEIYINDYTLKSGIIKTKLTNLYPDEIKYYTSLEYNYKDFTPYILYAKEILKFKEVSNAPENIRSKLKKQYRDKYSLGVRYDYNANIAFKLSYTHEIYSEEIKIHDLESNTNTLMGTINVIF